MYKVAYCIRPDYSNGGDGTQVIKTKQYIESTYNNIQIEIVTNSYDINPSFDLVHVFNYSTSDISRSFFEKALSLNIRIVSSPIYWDYSYSFDPIPIYFGFQKDFIDEKYVLKWRKINQYLPLFLHKKLKIIYHNISSDFKKHIRYFIDNSLLILPNSIEEGIKCFEFAYNDFCPNRDKIRVVYNGVDTSNVTILNKDIFFTKYNIPEKFILQVGRISFLKNQLNLITAMYNHPDIPIVILGGYNKSDKYVSKVREIGNKRGNVFFIDNIPHDEVYSFFHYAQTHVLLSLRESPGLVNLEALSQQCPIVVSDDRFLPVKTYFDELCEVVNPFNKGLIEEAVMKSYNKEHRAVNLSKFSWKKVAEDTYNAYMEVFNMRISKEK